MATVEERVVEEEGEREAGKGGHRDAMYQVALWHDSRSEIDKAMEFYLLAAMHGHTMPKASAEALYRVAETMLDDHEFREKSLSLRKAHAIVGTLVLNSTARRGGHAAPEHVESCDEVAAKFLQRAADQDHVQSKFALGLCNKNSWGVRQDYAKAFRLLDAAAMNGEPDAQHFLGLAYALGEGCTKDLRKAFTLFFSAAEQG